MRRLVYFIAATIDGHIAGPDGADPTGPDGFWPLPEDYVRHLVTEYPETLPAPARSAMSVTEVGEHFDTVLEGRKSYQLGTKAGIEDAYPHLRHIVFSRTLGPSEHVEVVAADPARTVRDLKGEEGKDIWLLGGARLAGSLYSEIDRLVVKVAPLTVGTGIPLFSAEFEPTAWRLSDHHRLDSGMLFLTYDRTG